MGSYLSVVFLLVPRSSNGSVSLSVKALAYMRKGYTPITLSSQLLPTRTSSLTLESRKVRQSLSSRQDPGLKSGRDKRLQGRCKAEDNGSPDLEGANATGSFPRMR